MKCYILAHGKKQEVFNRHMPYWERLDIPICVACPTDDPVETTHKRIFTGRSSLNGVHAVERLRKILEHFVCGDDAFGLFFEYDSICLLENVVERRGLHGCIKVTQPEHMARFISPRYVTSPWMLDRLSAHLMLEIAQAYPIFEEGMDDRYLSALAHLAGVPILDFPEGSYSQNNITPKFYSHIGNAMWIHGLKDKSATDILKT